MSCGTEEFVKGQTFIEGQINDSTIRGGVIEGSELKNVTGSANDLEVLGLKVGGTVELGSGVPEQLRDILQPLLSFTIAPEDVAKVFTSCRDGLALAPGARLATCEDLADVSAKLDDDLKLAICEAIRDGCGSGGGGGGGDDACCPENWNTIQINAAVSRMLSRMLSQLIENNLAGALISDEPDNCLKAIDNKLFVECGTGGTPPPPGDLISTDADNCLAVGSDAKLFVECGTGGTPTPPGDLISADADNCLVLGNDNKLYMACGTGGTPVSPSELISSSDDNCLLVGPDGKLFVECGTNDDVKFPTDNPGDTGTPISVTGDNLPLFVYGGRTALMGAPLKWVQLTATDGTTVRVPAY